MLSELTLTVMRLGLLVLMWFFVFAVVGVLRGDLYGTRVKRRAAGTGKAAARGVAPAPHGAARPENKKALPRPQGPHQAQPSPRARWRAPRCRCARPAP